MDHNRAVKGREEEFQELSKDAQIKLGREECASNINKAQAMQQ